IGAVLQHSSALAILDLPADLSSELEVVPFVVDGPGTVRLHVNTLVGIGDELFEGERLVSRKQADIGHANDRQAIPVLGAKSSARSWRTDDMCSLSRRQISREQPVGDNWYALRLHAFVVEAECAQARPMFLPRIGHHINQVTAVA